MANYVILIRWTDQGVRTVKETVHRAQQFRMDCERSGIKVRDFVWTQGRYDCIVSLESPDEQTMMTAMLALGNLGNVRTETLRAFTESEMQETLRKM